MGTPNPVVLQRKVLPKPWGGSSLQSLLEFGSEAAVGETWEVFDRPDGSNALRDHPGRTLSDYLGEHGLEDVLGRGVAPAAGGRFPLLIKFLHAAERLSVQVHPGADLAREFGDGPKHESWLILEAGPDAHVIRGFRPGVERADFEAAVADPERAEAALGELLHGFRPAVGDVIDLPAGIVHSVGPDVTLFEVQQNSDLTFRLHDWGRGRELHLEAARRAIRVADAGPDTVPIEPIGDGSSWLMRNDCFRVRAVRVAQPATLGTEGTFKIGTVLTGTAAFGWRSGGDQPPVRVARGETVLVPAATGAVFVSPIGRFEMLWTDPAPPG